MAKILEITSYPPPRSGWGVRVSYLKQLLEAQGHECVVLNIGSSRRIPSPEYEAVRSGREYLEKVVRFVRAGYAPHVHVNGATEKGVVLTILAQLVALWFRRPVVLTFHAGVEQVHFPRQKAPAWIPVFWLVFRLSRVIICNSEAVKARIVEYGVEPSRVVPIQAFSVQYLQGGAGTLPGPLVEFFNRFPHVIFCYIRLRPLFYPIELLQGFAELASRRADVGLVLCGASADDHGETALQEDTRGVIATRGIADRVHLVGDLEHETFLEALGRSSLYLRSHVSDGVCSSVLEALSLGVPVVASENGTRPPGVVTYPATDSAALGAALAETLERREMIVERMERPAVTDTLQTEADLLVRVATGR